jgi:hypothetical protein
VRLWRNVEPPTLRQNWEVHEVGKVCMVEPPILRLNWEVHEVGNVCMVEPPTLRLRNGGKLSER